MKTMLFIITFFSIQALNAQCKGLTSEIVDRFSGKRTIGGEVLSGIYHLGAGKIIENNDTIYMFGISVVFPHEIDTSKNVNPGPFNIIYGDDSKESLLGAKLSSVYITGLGYMYSYTLPASIQQLRKIERLKISYLGSTLLKGEFEKKTYKKQEQLIKCILAK